MTDTPATHPRGLRSYLAAVYLTLGLASALFGAFALGGLRGEWPMMLASIVVTLAWFGLLAWGIVSFARGWPALDANRGLLLTSLRRWLWVEVWVAPVVGLLLAFLAFVDCGPLWIPTMFHWFGLAMTILGLALFYSQPSVVTLLVGAPSPSVPSRAWWQITLHCVVLTLVWALVWGIPYFAMLKDSVNVANYAGAAAGFKLPWRGGEDGWVIQGSDTGMNHNDATLQQKFAWDFRRECGTPVLAAKAGKVTKVVVTNDGLGGSNNLVEVTLADGSVASYLHVQQNSAVVTVGQAVAQGASLASVGCVGNTLTGHIHFHVKLGSSTIPVLFDDVDGGVPRTFSSYTSGNTR